MRSNLLKCVMGPWPLLFTGCCTPPLQPDVGMEDAGLVSIDAPLTDAPPPPLNCDDPALWAAPAMRRGVRSFVSFSGCSEDAPRLYLGIDLRQWGQPGCARVTSSSRADIPLGTFPLPTASPTTLGMIAPADVDVEIRSMELVEGAWALVSERGVSPSVRTLALRAPYSLPMEGRVRAVFNDIYANETELITLSTPSYRSPHHGAFAFGDLGMITRSPEGIGELHGIVFTGEAPPPPLELGPVDQAHTFLLPFGVISGARLLIITDGRIVQTVELPSALDEVAVGELKTLARAGATPYTIDVRGAHAVPGLEVDRVLVGGFFVDTAGEIASADGARYGTYDTAIGTPYASDRFHVYGEHGIAAIGPGNLIGPAARILDPRTEGFSPVAAPDSEYVVTRPDGTTVLYLNEHPERSCD